MAVFHFIEGFYNNSRRHSAMVCLWSIGYEKEASWAGLTRPGRKLSPEAGNAMSACSALIARQVEGAIRCRP